MLVGIARPPPSRRPGRWRHGLLERAVRTAALAGLVASLMTTTSAVRAQAHEERFGDFVVRSSVLRSSMLPDATLREHGIAPAANRAVVNVVVLHGTEPVRADVTVGASDLNGRLRTIDVRPVAANGGVSYLGVFEFLPREVLDFRIEATPAGGGPRLDLAYRERMWFYVR